MSKTILFAGSFNLSTNAEFKQFDNLVSFKGKTYKLLFNDYYQQHHTPVVSQSPTITMLPKSLSWTSFLRFTRGNPFALHAKKIERCYFINLEWSGQITKANAQNLSQAVEGIISK